MTQGLRGVFDLPSLDEVLEETETPDIDCDDDGDDLPAVMEGGSELLSMAEMSTREHSKAMDDIYLDTLKHAKDAADLAFDLDPARAPRMLEVAAIHYKTAMDAKNSKRDQQLKLMKLLQDQRKLELEEKKFAQETGTLPTDRANVVMVEDRNELLRRLKGELTADKGRDK